MADWLKILKEYVDALETALGNPTGDMSAVTQSDAASLAAFLIYFREMSRAHNQGRICLVVPDLANLASDLPNTAIKAELDKIGTVSVLDQTGVDDGQEDWDFYDLIVVGSNTYAPFTNTNIDDLILLKVPILVCNRDVAMHLKIGETQTQSASDVNEYCETIHNRVMYVTFGSVGEKVLFSEATQSDRLDMSDASLAEEILMVDTTADGETKAVIGWLPMEDGVGGTNTLIDDTDMPACRIFAGCFVGADKLTDLGTDLLRRLARNVMQASISPSIALKAAAAQVAAILNDTADMQPKLGTPAASLAEDIAAIAALVDSAEAVGPFSYLDAGGEQDVYVDAATTRRRIWLEFSNRNMTQTGTFIIYRKVDGANYDIYATQPVTIGAGDDRAFDAEFVVNQAWKLTYEEDVDEGAARAIPYNVITQVIE